MIREKQDPYCLSVVDATERQFSCCHHVSATNEDALELALTVHDGVVDRVRNVPNKGSDTAEHTDHLELVDVPDIEKRDRHRHDATEILRDFAQPIHAKVRPARWVVP